MPLLIPEKGEGEKEFIPRCMDSEAMKREYPEQKQRLGVCYSQLRRAGRKIPKPKK